MMFFLFPRRLALPVLFLPAVLLLSGCYDRWTGNYDKVQELTPENSAVVETSEVSDAEHHAQLELLQKIANTPEAIYTINAGDKLDIKVYNHNDLTSSVIVTPDGYIGLVLVGQLKVSELTLQQATEKIEKALSKYVRNPKVGVSPALIVSETATISGAVSKPGIYTIANGMRLADLFAKAGGASSRYYDGQTLEAADYANSMFIRNNQVIPVDFTKAIETGDPLHNVLLRRGDYIFIAARDNSMVYMIGDVKSPGRQVWTRQLGLLEALSAAGWMQETHWRNVIIIRGGVQHPTMYKVDIDAIIRGEKKNLPLKSGDIVYVPHDNISEYNVFIRKLFPTAQLVNMMLTPASWMISRF